jgi:uncharacterized lipoprotein YddW (UPF0748 family)
VKRRIFSLVCLLFCVATRAALAQTPPLNPLAPITATPPPVAVPYVPFPHLGDLALDEGHNGYGIAQTLSRKNGWQGRLLWIDGTANLERVNTKEKIAALVKKAKEVGFNTLVFDVKPIIGYTLYPSQFAPKLTEWVRPWGTQKLPKDFDPLAEMCRQCKSNQMGLIVSLNAFSEGHREFQKGPGYEHPDWQTVLYEPQTRVGKKGGTDSYPLSDRTNAPARTTGDLSLYTDLTQLTKPAPGTRVAFVDKTGTVQALWDAMALIEAKITLPAGLGALVGTPGKAADFLTANARIGEAFTLTSAPIYVPIAQRYDRQTPLMTNPHHPEVRKRALGFIKELTGRYPIDGIIYDDRLRYAAINSDFSDISKRAFETWLGKPVQWPTDIFTYSQIWPEGKRVINPGPYYDAWNVFRAQTIRNFLAEAITTARSKRPGLTFATYVGSWYPDYPDIGANWAATDLPAGYRFLSDAHKQTGWAGLVDFITTGCYQGTPTMNDALALGQNIGDTIEAAGQFSNRAVNDATFVYAGISLERYKNRPNDLKHALQAACATTQGVMCFDLSHDIEPLWPIFAEVFKTPAPAPHQVSNALNTLRTERARVKALGIPDPPVIQYRGTSGIGF